MAVGAFARHRKILSSEVDRSLASFSANVLLPAFFFNRIMVDKNLSVDLSSWSPAFIGAGLTSFGFLCAFLLAKSIGRWFGITNNSQQRTFSLTAGIANYGFIPFPLAEVFYPNCVVTLLVHNVGVDVAMWSVGLYLISGQGLKKSWKRIAFSPPLLAVVAALLIRHFGATAYVPNPILSATGQLGRCSVPIGLVLSGAIIYECVTKVDFTKAWQPFALAVGLRIVLLPILFLIIAKYGITAIEMKEVLLLQAAMPAATFPIVMTRLFNQDIEVACTVVVGTSLLGLFTIPLWMVIGAGYLGF